MFEEKAETLFYRVTSKGAEEVKGAVIGESRWVMYVNDQELVTLMATPRNLHHLALGFLVSEDLIKELAEVASIRVNLAPDRAYWIIPSLGLNEMRSMPVCEEGVGSIFVRLTRLSFTIPSRRVVTSGCGGGVTFDNMTRQQARLESKRPIRPGQVLALMQELNANAQLYRECRGVHTSALADGDRIIALAEDVGRHNTLDKIRGDCLLRGLDPRDGVILSTGRISSEMITKAAKMGVPIVVSRTSPTHLAVELAKAWNMTLIGYAHAGQMQVYAGMERICLDP